MTQTVNDFNFRSQNSALKKAIETSIGSIFPITSKNKQLVLDNIKIDDSLNDYDFPTQREMKLNHQTWQMPITADFKLIDTDTGRVLDTMKNKKIGNLPKITNRYTTLIDGNEYQTTNQFRRKSGVYSRIKKNGELEAEFNLSKGRNFKMMMDPTSGVFYLIFSNRKYRVWTLLNTLGVTELAMSKAWGKEVLDINKKGAYNTEDSELKAIYNIIYGKQPSGIAEAQSGIIKYFTDGTEMDGDVNKLTLGEAFTKVNAESLLATSSKLLDINKGEEIPDERDSLIFKDFYTIDDLVTSYFNKNKKVLKSKIERGLGLRERIKDVITPAVFSDPIKKFFTVGDLASTLPQTNPVTILAETRKTTPMGTGGIESHHAITMDMRNLHPSHLGFLDGTSTPESFKVGISLGLGSEIRKEGKNLFAPVVDKNNKVKWLSPLQMYENVIGFPDQFKVDPKSGKTVPISDNVKVMKKGKTIEVPSSEVDYYIRSPKTLFSIQTNLIPFLANTQGNRASTGARMITQALPLHNPDAPLVENFRDSTSTYEQLAGHTFGPNSEVDGIVSKIEDEYIYIKDASGIEHKYGLYKNFPLNQDGFVNSNVLVKVGDRVKKGELLAGNNYTVGDKLAIAKNLNVGFLSYKGLNFEDGLVITEGAAKKLTHDTIHKEDIYFSPKLTVFNKDKFNAWYPDELTTANYNKLNATGIIGKGQKVQHGDVIAAYLVEKEMSDLDNALKRLDKITFNQYEKKVLRWENQDPGEVIDVRKIGRNIDIYIKASHPTREGDKLSSLYGNKGIVTAIIPDNDAPTRSNGEPIEVMMSAEGVPGRMNIGQILTTAASKIAEKQGKPFIVNNFNDPNGDSSKEIIDKAKELGIDLDEVLTDGKNGKPIKQAIFVGKQPMMKLRHIIDKKSGSHSVGAYDVYGGPAGKGAQRAGTLDVYAYLAHGAKCFTSNTLVETDKGPMTISKIYEKDLNSDPIFAKSYNLESNRIEYKRIINKFKYFTDKDDVIKIKRGQYVISGTPRHDFYNINYEKEQIGKINNILVENIENISELQKQLIIGTFLGDGYISKHNKLSVTHTIKQRKYFNYLCNSLNSHKTINVKTNGYSNASIVDRFTTPVNDFTRYIRNIGYNNSGTKIVLKELINILDTLGLLILYLDDGTFWYSKNKNHNYGTIKIATYSFTEEENNLIANRILELTGAKFKVKLKDNKYWQLVCSIKEDINKFFNSINYNIITDDMKYKFYNTIEFNKEYNNKILPLVQSTVTKHPYKFPPSNVQCKKKIVYDIEVEDNHNYFLSTGYLVSNSNLEEMSAVKGRKNEEYWRDLQFGLPPGKPARNFVWEKMIADLKGMGVNVNKEGSTLRILPLTDKDTLEMSNGEIKDPGTLLIGKNLLAKKGGLFDKDITGGAKGTSWGHFNLATRIPNPMFEDAIMKLTGLTENKYADIIDGKDTLNGKSGVDAIVYALGGIDVDKELKSKSEELKTAPPTNVNKLNTTVKYLKTLKNLKLSATDAYTISKVPVTPPQFRPIYPLPSGDLMVSDINKHYKDVGVINNGLRANLADGNLTAQKEIESKAMLYNTVKALQGIIDPLTYSKQKYKGFLKDFGKVKTGLVHGRMWSKSQDLSGRSTITVEPDLGIDEVGVPKEMAYNMWKPLIIKELKSYGLKAADSKKQYNDKTELAYKALSQVAQERPIIINRAPSLHKHSVQAFRPILTDGKAIKLNPLIFKGLNSDLDGDTVSIMTPIGTAAVEEAKDMVPSKILFKHGDNQLMPELSKDYIFGLFQASKLGNKTGKSFKNITEAKKSGLDMTDVFSLNGKEMTIGQYYINEPLPTELKDYTREINKKVSEKILTDIGKNYPTYFANVITTWKNIGFNYAHSYGHTISINDFNMDKSYRNDLIKSEMPKINKLNGKEKIDKLNALTLKIQDLQNKQIQSGNNHLKDMVNSGSFTKTDSIRQIISMPGVLVDVKGEPIEIPVLKSYGEGLDTAAYFNSLYAVRKGTIDRSVNTQESGALTKSLLSVARRTIITETDCNTNKHINIPINSKDVLDRFSAVTVPGVVKHNELINTAVITKARQNNITELAVRSPLTCEAPNGICQKCYGLLPNGKEAPLGTNVGILDGEALSERSTQLSMQCAAHFNLLHYNLDGKIGYSTHEDLWNLIESEIKIINGMESKFSNKLKLLSGDSWVPVTNIQRHKPLVPMVMIKTKDGNALITQKDHPLRTYNNKNTCLCHTPNLKRISDSSMKCDTCKRVHTVAPDLSQYTDKYLSEVKFKEDGFKVDYTTYLNKNGELEDPIFSGYITGIYTGDGNIQRTSTKYWGIMISSFISSIHNNIIAKIKDNNLTPNTNIKNVIKIYNVEAAKQMESLISSKARNKKITTEFYKYSKEWLKGFMSGLIDSDGCIVKKNKNTYIKIYSSSWALLQQVFIISKILNFNCKLNKAIAYGPTALNITSKLQPYYMEIRLKPENLDIFDESVKVTKSYNKNSKIFNNFNITKGIDPITSYKELEIYNDYTYDFKVNGDVYSSNGIEYHNTFHCYHSGSIIQTEGGELFTIKELVNSDFRGKVLDNNGEFTQIVGSSKHEVTNPMKIIMSKNKRQIIAQGNHPIQVKDTTEKCYYCDSILIEPKGDKYFCNNCHSKFKKDLLDHDVPIVTKEINDVELFDNSLVRVPFIDNFGTKPWDFSISHFEVAKYIMNRNEFDVNKLDENTQQMLKKECGDDVLERHLPHSILLYDKKIALEMLFFMLSLNSKFYLSSNSRLKRRHMGSVVTTIKSYALSVQLTILLQKFGYLAKNSIISCDPESIYNEFADERYKKGHYNYNIYRVVVRMISYRFFEALSIPEQAAENKIKIFYNFPTRQNSVSRIKHYTHAVFEDQFVYDLKTKSQTLTVNEIWSHNSGGSALAGGGILAGFPNMQRLLEVPEKLSNKATLALNPGVVYSIDKNAIGGYNINVNGVQHISLPGQSPMVAVGDVVERGDQLSSGAIKPQELGQLKTHLDAQNYIVNEMNNVYDNKFTKKTFETVVRSISDNAEITDAPDDTDFIRGDKTTISYINFLNKKREKEGAPLIQYKPYFKSIETLNVDNNDWMTKTTTNRIKAAIRTGAAKGQYTNLKGNDPIPAYLYGDDFSSNVYSDSIKKNGK